MISYLDNKIQEPTKNNYFGPDFIYDERDGWKVAFGITAYDNSSDNTLFDDSYGTLGAYEKIWGEEDADGNVKDTYFKKLETEPCRESEINLDGDENQDKYLFYEPAEEFLSDMKRFYGILQCIKDEATLMGDYNSAKGK